MTFPEQEVIKLIICYGTVKIDEHRSFTQYVLEQIEDIPFQTPLYAKMLDIIKSELNKGNITNENFFLTHQDEEIKNETINLVSEPYEVSVNWAKHGIDVPEEKDILPNIAYITILHLKWKNVQKKSDEIKKAIQKTINERELEQLQRVHMELKEIEMKIALELGNTVAK